MFVKIFGLVALPIIISIYFGQCVDDYYKISPWGTIISVLIMSVVSTFSIVYISLKEITNL